MPCRSVTARSSARCGRCRPRCRWRSAARPPGSSTSRTGSAVLPLKALVMNALTLSATFGVLVLVFQDGRLEGLLDFETAGGVEATQPVLLFAIAFGLATDYAVFLLSRIKEA